MKETVIVSLCAFGVSCRYHGQSHKMGHRLYKEKKTEELREKYNVLPLCGEIMGGLPTPRPACNVVETEDGLKVVGRFDGKDYTAEYEKGSEEILRLAEIFDVKKAFLLKDSPMCGRCYGMLARKLADAGVRVCNV